MSLKWPSSQAWCKSGLAPLDWPAMRLVTMLWSALADCSIEYGIVSLSDAEWADLHSQKTACSDYAMRCEWPRPSRLLQQLLGRMCSMSSCDC